MSYATNLIQKVNVHAGISQRGGYDSPHFDLIELFRDFMLQYQSELSLKNKVARAAWGIVWLLLFRPSPRPFFGWRRALVNCFGGKVARGARIYPSVRIWAPWNLRMESQSCLADFVDCYSVALITLDAGAIVSQYTFLCSASHDTHKHGRRMIRAPIKLESSAWVCASCFVGMGVTVGENSIVAAGSVLVKSVQSNVVVGGNPAHFIKHRVVLDG